MFEEKSATYINVSYLMYLIDLSAIHEWDWGVVYLVYLYSKLSECCLWTTRQMTGCMLTVISMTTNILITLFFTLVSNIFFLFISRDESYLTFTTYTGLSVWKGILRIEHVLACITRLKRIMLCIHSVCMLTGLHMVTSTRHHTPLTGTLFSSIPFYYTLDGWHAGEIWCACIF